MKNYSNILFCSILLSCIEKKYPLKKRKEKKRKKNVVFKGQAKYSYFSADFRLKIFLYYCQIVASDFAILECVGV